MAEIRKRRIAVGLIDQDVRFLQGILCGLPLPANAFIFAKQADNIPYLDHGMIAPRQST